jgi:2-polyprenyl-3-methyl-5-hydroxy-6-metoxy-1,4-benzoquinol methylase
MSSSYQPESVRRDFDDSGVKEWERLVHTPIDEVSLFIHTHYLKKYITQNQKVLEIGAGAGRFTQILAGLGVQIVVADISQVQLELNQKFAGELGFRQAILDWQQVDICDLSRFADAEFDSVIAYGGPFSYVLDQRDVALAECLRVLKPGGLLLLSVMSLWGTAHAFFDEVLSLPPETNHKIIFTGDLTADTYPGRTKNFMHLFRSSELLPWLEQAGLKVLDKSAANSLSLTWNETLKQIRNDSDQWQALLRMELEACAQNGCLDSGTHLIAVARNE